MIREKAGQPVKMGSGKRGFNISLYVDPEQMAVLEEIRWRERQSMSSIIRKAVQEYIKAHGAGNDTFRLDNWSQDPTFQAVPTIFSDPVNWFKYLSDCKPEERSRILKAANIIRTNAIRIGNLIKK